MYSDATDAAILAWLDQEDRFVTETIRKHGCFIEYVYAEGDDPSFAYTVGLFGIGHPELIVFGFDPGSSAKVLNHFFAQVKDGSDLMPGEMLRPWGDHVTFLVEQVLDPGSVVLSANRHYRRPPEASVPALQLTWSDGVSSLRG